MLINDKEYLYVRDEAFSCIRNAQYSAVLSVNHSLILRNINIGNLIISKVFGEISSLIIWHEI